MFRSRLREPRMLAAKRILDERPRISSPLEARALVEAVLETLALALASHWRGDRTRARRPPAGSDAAGAAQGGARRHLHARRRAGEAQCGRPGPLHARPGEAAQGRSFRASRGWSKPTSWCSPPPAPSRSRSCANWRATPTSPLAPVATARPRPSAPAFSSARTPALWSFPASFDRLPDRHMAPCSQAEAAAATSTINFYLIFLRRIHTSPAS